jgi:SnoaL-like polyketide cyclase
VAVRVFAEGTNLGPLNGVVPPTGKRFTARQSHWFRVEGGRLAEHWATRKDLPVMLQLGVVQPPVGRRPSLTRRRQAEGAVVRSRRLEGRCRW